VKRIPTISAMDAMLIAQEARANAALTAHGVGPRVGPPHTG
jgi:hypothetical protein